MLKAIALVKQLFTGAPQNRCNEKSQNSSKNKHDRVPTHLQHKEKKALCPRFLQVNSQRFLEQLY